MELLDLLVYIQRIEMNEKKNLTIEQTFALAVQNHKKNNLKIAENLYKKILKINPNLAGVHYNLGIMYKDIMEYTKSIDILNELVSMDKGSKEVYNNLGIAYKGLDDNVNASNMFKKAIEIDPEFLLAKNNLDGLDKEN